MKLKKIALAMSSAVGSTTLLASTLAVGLATASSAAFAEQDNYPGAACQPRFPRNDDTFLQYLEVAAENFSEVAGRTVSVVCPIIRNENGKNQRLSVSVTFVRDPLADRPFNCELTSHKKNGLRVAEARFSETGTLLKERFLTVLNSEPGGVYLLQCDIPNNGSSLISYRATDF